MTTRIPKYRRHLSGQARVTIAGKTFYLGKYGTLESRQSYQRLINEWLTKTGCFASSHANPENRQPLPTGTTVNEVALAYVKHAEEYYRTNPKEVEKVRLSVRPLQRIYGRSQIAVFDSLALETIQNAMIDSGLARNTINERIRVLKRLFKWGVRKKMVPAIVMGELMAVEGLKRGRTMARETEPVRPVPQKHIDAVLPLVSRHVAGLIRLQLLTAARPGELCDMRRCDIDMDGKVWVYRPTRHKNHWRGHARGIYLGPRAQELVRGFFRLDLEGYLFSPREAREERFRMLRAKRRSKVPPSQVCRRKANPIRSPGEQFTSYSYRRAITHACEAAGVPSWRPNQLRHNAATNLRKEYGVELARIILGHKTAFTTEIYAEADQEQAIAVMAKIG